MSFPEILLKVLWFGTDKHLLFLALGTLQAILEDWEARNRGDWPLDENSFLGKEF